jgi:hypothetical protein
MVKPIAHYLVNCKTNKVKKIVVYLTSSCVNWAIFGMSGPV